MNKGENLEWDGVLNTTRTEQFLNHGIIDERINKLFTGERSNIKHKSFKEELARQLRHSKLNDNKRKRKQKQVK
jgi:hypothetical protein